MAEDRVKPHSATTAGKPSTSSTPTSDPVHSPVDKHSISTSPPMHLPVQPCSHGLGTIRLEIARFTKTVRP